MNNSRQVTGCLCNVDILYRCSRDMILLLLLSALCLNRNLAIFTIPGMKTQTYESDGDFKIGAVSSMRLKGLVTQNIMGQVTRCVKLCVGYIQHYILREINSGQSIMLNINHNIIFLNTARNYLFNKYNKQVHLTSIVKYCNKRG